jgi:hypothetical protein
MCFHDFQADRSKSRFYVNDGTPKKLYPHHLDFLQPFTSRAHTFTSLISESERTKTLIFDLSTILKMGKTAPLQSQRTKTNSSTHLSSWLSRNSQKAGTIPSLVGWFSKDRHNPKTRWESPSSEWKTEFSLWDVLFDQNSEKLCIVREFHHQSVIGRKWSGRIHITGDWNKFLVFNSLYPTNSSILLP